MHPDNWYSPLTSDGPASWQRVNRDVQPAEGAAPADKCASSDGSAWGWLTNAPPEQKPLPAVKVSNISSTDDSISFDVDQVGVPVVVKTSYFPNWKASGADGPWRTTPNEMVVVPTSNHVELHYGYTGLDLFAYALTALGLVGLVLLFRAKPVDVSAPTWLFGRTEQPERFPRPPAGGAGGAAVVPGGAPPPEMGPAGGVATAVVPDGPPLHAPVPEAGPPEPAGGRGDVDVVPSDVADPEDGDGQRPLP
jgi:hypothetical protein